MKHIILAFLIFFTTPSMAQPVHGLAMHGDLKYPADFKHFDYVNPDAPKGGILKEHSVGTFDTLNGFILKGVPADNLGLIYETLMAQSDDEPFSEYGRIAKTVEVAADNSSITFNLHEEAKFHDGTPITPEDVIWTFETLKTKGLPFYRAYYGDVDTVTKTGDHQVTFHFSTTENKELPLIIGQLPVLPKHYWADKDFGATTLTPPLGSGPYKVKSVDVGKQITFERVADYWGKDLPVNKGMYNFDTIQVDYYRDATVAVEALLAGEYDYRQENIAKTWATTYQDSDVVKSGKIKMEEIAHERPAGMQAFIMNVRRPVFQDIAVRRAINLAFDFEWANKQFAYGAYTRTNSYFMNSELASSGKPKDLELELLTPFKDQLPAEVFTEEFKIPKTDGSGNNRKQLKEAIKLLDDAGYTIGADGIRIDPKTRQPLSFEIIDNQPAFERWTLPLIQNLKKIGIEASFRVIDTSQYQNRILDHDYDMTVQVIPQSLSPGNEQREYWDSDKAGLKGSKNWIGVQDPVVDALVNKIINANSREMLVAATHALDRVLLWHYYVIPQWHLNSWRLVYWDKFGRPKKTAPYDLNLSKTWWSKE